MFPRYVLNPKSFKKVTGYSNCIVIGSGIAGLSTAINLSKQHKVKILTKSTLPESTTWYAQGGIAAAIKKPDFWKNHYEDTIEAGQGLCDSSAVKILVRKAPKMIEKLIEFGINFDISSGEISLTTEGGHSFPRILHAGGDATGEEIEKKLVENAKNSKNIEFYPNYFVTDILAYKNRVIGVMGLDTDKNLLEIHPCSYIILASGGIGQLYELTTNPEISTGDGIAMAYRAGASIMDIEFIQFHPTVFKTKDGSLFLISEALRGEGAYLRDCNGKRFMLNKHPRAELAPRDIVVKEMVRVMNESQCHYVYLDATHLPRSMLKIRFPNIISKLKENGLDLKKDLIKVSPAAHYMNGGVKTGHDGLTDIEGLYSCGEVAATGAHGANRLASNSLIEGLVYGWNIYKDINKKLKRETADKNNIKKNIEKVLAKPQTAVLKEKKIKDIDKIISELRTIMSENVGILRDKKGLLEARDFIENYVTNKDLYGRKTKKAKELINMLTVAKLIINAARIRKESRGTHQRNDYPQKDNKNWKKHIIQKNGKIFYKEVE